MRRGRRAGTASKISGAAGGGDLDLPAGAPAPAAGALAPYRILAHRRFLFFFLGSFVSMFGSEMTSAVLQWVVLKRTGSEAAVGTLLSLSMLPGLLFLPFTGVFIDRHDRRHVAIALDVARCFVVASVPVALLLFRDTSVVHLYAVAILVGFGFNVYWANASALIQEICEPGEFTGASAFFAAAIQGGTLIAGALVGFTFDRIGLGGVMTIDACTYAFSAWCLSRVRTGRRAPNVASASRPAGTLGAFSHDLREGLRFLWHERGVLRVGLITIFVLAGVFGLQVVTAPLNAKVLNSGPHGFGFCNGAWGLGAMVASQAGLFLLGRVPERLSIALPLLMVAIACAAVPFSPGLSAALLGFFVMGYGRGASGIVLFVRLLRSVPRELMGRVQTVVSFFGLMLRISVMLATGFVARDVSVRAAFGIAAAMWLLAVGFAIPRWPAVRTGRVAGNEAAPGGK